jgi:hypothetical protein
MVAIQKWCNLVNAGLTPDDFCVLRPAILRDIIANFHKEVHCEGGPAERSSNEALTEADFDHVTNCSALEALLLSIERRSKVGDVITYMLCLNVCRCW